MTLAARRVYNHVATPVRSQFYFAILTVTKVYLTALKVFFMSCLFSVFRWPV